MQVIMKLQFREHGRGLAGPPLGGSTSPMNKNFTWLLSCPWGGRPWIVCRCRRPGGRCRSGRWTRRGWPDRRRPRRPWIDRR